jgi:hypothetical protein
LVLALEGEANKDHLDVIYRYDQDTNKNIFIPYLYMTNIFSNGIKFTINMGRTFASQNKFQFDLVPVKDEFGVTLCECQFEMFNARMTANFDKRAAILEVLVTNIVSEVNQIASLLKKLTALNNTVINKTKLTTLTASLIAKIKECDAIDKQITAANVLQANSQLSLSGKNKKMPGFDSDIISLKNNLNTQNMNLKTETTTITQNVDKILALMLKTKEEMTLSNIRDYANGVTERVNAQNTPVINLKTKFLSADAVNLNGSFKIIFNYITNNQD